MERQHTSTQETGFEKKRGIGKIDVRTGYAQVLVSRLEGEIVQARLRLLEAIKDAQIGIDFLKLTPSGLSCLVAESDSEKISQALQGHPLRLQIHHDRSIVLVHAVNMRDEEGLIARIVQKVIESGAPIDHLGDMHDRVLLVVPGAHAEALVQVLETLKGNELAH